MKSCRSTDSHWLAPMRRLVDVFDCHMKDLWAQLNAKTLSLRSREADLYLLSTSQSRFIFRDFANI